MSAVPHTPLNIAREILRNDKYLEAAARKQNAVNAERGMILLAYLNDETTGFSDAKIDEDLETIGKAEDRLWQKRQELLGRAA